MQNHTTTSPSARSSAKLITEELAAALRIVPQTIRAGLCRNGHYLGLRPTKLPNGRLLWDAAEVARLTGGEGA
jgi:hypothetical protein